MVNHRRSCGRGLGSRSRGLGFHLLAILLGLLGPWAVLLAAMAPLDHRAEDLDLMAPEVQWGAQDLLVVAIQVPDAAMHPLVAWAEGLHRVNRGHPKIPSRCLLREVVPHQDLRIIRFLCRLLTPTLD